MRFNAPSLMAGENYEFVNEVVELDCEEVAKIFKVLKSKGILKNSIKFYLGNENNLDELLNSNEFIDKIKYFRISKGITMRTFAKQLKIDDETYRQYEIKYTEIQSPFLAEQMIKILNIGNVLELPDYFKIKKKYGVEEIRKIIMENGGKEYFSKETNIHKLTIATWFYKNVIKDISTYSYRKMVKFFKDNNIEF